jgi:hypothetical protein
MGISALAVAGLLSGCASGAFSTQSARIGTDDGTDSCRQQLVALDSTGDYFGADILKGAVIGAAGGGLIGGLASGDIRGALIGAAAGAAVGGAAGYWSSLQQQQHDQAGLRTQVTSDLTQENAQIDKTQIAFDQLMDCRFNQAASIRADLAAGRIDRPTAVAAMARVKDRVQRDLQVAQTINGQIQGRAQQFDVAANNLSPGTQAMVEGMNNVPSRPAVARAPTAVKLRPDPSAPDIAQLQPRERVTVHGGRAGYALVETDSGVRGFAPTSELLQPGKRRPTPVSVPQQPVATANSGDVRTLAGSNAARRDAFAQSVSVSQQAASTGFELAAG